MDELIKAIFFAPIATLLIITGVDFLAIADLVVGLTKGDLHHLEGDRPFLDSAIAPFNVVKSCLVWV